MDDEQVVEVDFYLYFDFWLFQVDFGSFVFVVQVVVDVMFYFYRGECVFVGVFVVYGEGFVG